MRTPGLFLLRCGLVRRALLLEAVAAIHGLVTARLERNLGNAAAARACCFEHLALAAATVTAAAAATATATAHARGLAGLPAIRATAGLVLEALLFVELLFAGGKRELIPAVDAGYELICIH